MRSWWSKLLGGDATPPVSPAPAPAAAPPTPPAAVPPAPPPAEVSPAAEPELPRARVLPADQNRFGVPLLDLTPLTGAMVSTTTDPANAQRAVSWPGTLGEDISLTLVEPVEVAWPLRYPVAALFPEGLVFAPRSMEQKWVVAHRAGCLVAARSWTGVTQVVAPFRIEGGCLVIDRFQLCADELLSTFGPPGPLVDWLIRTHALGEILPMPVDAGGWALLEATPLAAFSAFGEMARCAAVGWSAPPPIIPLRAEGAVTVAVMQGDAGALRRLHAGAARLDAPARGGYTPLHIALLRADAGTATLLLELGADPDAKADDGATPTILAVVNKVPVLAALHASGARLDAANTRGFGPVHAVAEIDDPTALSFLLAHGAAIDARTGDGFTPLHIAAALGHLRALSALLGAGADPHAPSSRGTPRELAVQENRPLAAALLPE